MSSTLGQHSTNVIQMFRVCWVSVCSLGKYCVILVLHPMATHLADSVVKNIAAGTTKQYNWESCLIFQQFIPHPYT